MAESVVSSSLSDDKISGPLNRILDILNHSQSENLGVILIKVKLIILHRQNLGGGGGKNHMFIWANPPPLKCIDSVPEQGEVKVASGGGENSRGIGSRRGGILAGRRVGQK